MSHTTTCWNCGYQHADTSCEICGEHRAGPIDSPAYIQYNITDCARKIEYWRQGFKTAIQFETPERQASYAANYQNALFDLLDWCGLL